jgi:hypothetical protein
MATPVARRLVSVFGLAMGLHAAACGNEDGDRDVWPPPRDASPATDAPETSVPRCTPPTGASGSPADIDGIVALVNALGAQRSFPLDLTCFLESLDRPLGALASLSIFSLQPTNAPRSPRFFLWSGTVVMTVVPTGDGRNLLELGQQVSETRSVKAEIHFPVTAPLPPAQPYEHIIMEGGATSCGTCHGFEQPAPQAATQNAFSSDVFKPLKTQEIDLAFLQGQYLACDAAAEPERCAMFAAIFAHGELVPRAFSDKARTIYDN